MKKARAAAQRKRKKESTSVARCLDVEEGAKEGGKKAPKKKAAKAGKESEKKSKDRLAVALCYLSNLESRGEHVVKSCFSICCLLFWERLTTKVQQLI